MSIPRSVIEQMLAQRRRYVDLGGGLRVQVQRPAEAEVGEFLRSDRLSAARRWVVGWEGFTGATFLGAGVGSGDAVPFDAELWSHYIADHAEHLDPIVARLIELVTERAESKRAAAKN